MRRINPRVALIHVTDAARLPAIQRDGLDPAKSREPAFRGRHVYFSGDEGHAAAYDGHHGDWKLGAAMLRVDSASLDSSLLGPDDVDLPDLMRDSRRNWQDVRWNESLKLSGQCAYAGVVPASLIEFRLGGPDGAWLPLEGTDLSSIAYAGAGRAP